MKDKIEKLNIPDIFNFLDNTKVKTLADWHVRREELKDIICNEEYGTLPKHVKIRSKTLSQDENYCGGKAIYKDVLITLMLEEEFSFMIKISYPKSNQKVPLFLYLSFHNEFPNKYLPVEEICDSGFGVCQMYYEDITLDKNRFDDKLSSIINKKSKKRTGKIMIWAYAAMHIMDYLEKENNIDKENVAIVGHSRLGKTALLAGALDERFKYVISNDSGQSGAAISRGKKGEKIKDICTVFPYWFCEKYSFYVDKELLMPFDQHYLTSLIAPRYLYISSASNDDWADPKSEFLNCIITSKAYKLYGKKGLICTDFEPRINKCYIKGNIGYHLRCGTHYLSRYDWNCYIKYIKQKMS